MTRAWLAAIAALAVPIMAAAQGEWTEKSFGDWWIATRESFQGESLVVVAHTIATTAIPGETRPGTQDIPSLSIVCEDGKTGFWAEFATPVPVWRETVDVTYQIDDRRRIRAVWRSHVPTGAGVDGDEAIQALRSIYRSGQALSVAIGGEDLTFSLHGADRAIQVASHECGWKP